MNSVLLSLVVFLTSVTGARPLQSPSLEYDVKAAFLINFARYVEWPPAVRRDRSFGLCVLEPDPFGDRLETAVAGELWETRPIAIRRLTDLSDLRECHLLYVPAAAAGLYAEAKKTQLSKLPILTVGEANDFVKNGGMIQLLVEQNRVKFFINQRAADAVGLRVSSRLLRLARLVIQKEAS
jgi:hypothetical protein